MGILSDMKQRVNALESCGGTDAEGRALLDAIRVLSTDAVVDLVSIASAIKHDADRLIAVGAAVVAERSTRELGQSGAAAVRGHATPVSLVQSISGGTRADAVRAVRVGEALLEAAAALDESSDVAAAPCWHDVLDRALLRGSLTSAQHDAIRRGLGEPPADLEASSEVWALAAEQLVAESDGIEVEELARVPGRCATRWIRRGWKSGRRNGSRHVRCAPGPMPTARTTRGSTSPTKMPPSGLP